MRISRRTSGGRGEYEVSEQSLAGLRPADLQNKQLTVGLGERILIPTSTCVVVQGEKPRLRIQNVTSASIHLHLQVAAALMMPHPAREERVLAGGLPMMRTNQYAIEHIALKDVRLSSEGALLLIDDLTLHNFSYHAEPLDVSARLEMLGQVWARKSDFPPALAELLAAHEMKVTSKTPLDVSCELVVQNIQIAVTDLSEDLGVPYRSASEDALLDLWNTLGISSNPPMPPIKVSEIDPRETVIKRRVTKEWKRWANSRGSASAVFRQKVRLAYRSTCIVCGLHLPGTSMNSVPGVDAAHILPWSDYDLDVVPNGLCLCKLHHWAFDEGLIGLAEENGIYRLELLPGVQEVISAENPLFAINSLLHYCGVIPAERLPYDKALWPSPRFLQLLRDSD